MQPRDRDTVRSSKVTHSGIASSFSDPKHRLIVFVKHHSKFVRKKSPPQGETREATTP